MNKLNEYYSGLKMSVSAKDMTQRVISASASEKPKRIALNKPVVAAAAAAVVLVSGVTAGAATGLFSFNDIFRSIGAENQQLNESLVGVANNITYSISDDDYAVRLNGVSGSPASLLANIEIYRTDGNPINNGADETYINVRDIRMKDTEDTTGCSYNYAINSEGNFDIDWETRLGFDRLIDGETIVGGEIQLCGSVEFEDCGERRTVDWDMAFGYISSEASTRVVKAIDTSEICRIYTDMDRLTEVDCDISAITLTSTTGYVHCSQMTASNGNDIRLIKKDGGEISADIVGAYGEKDGSCYLTIRYFNEDYTKELAIDVTELEAISINGTVYELK